MPQCPICKAEYKMGDNVCAKCGLDDLLNIPVDPEEYISWLENHAIPQVQGKMQALDEKINSILAILSSTNVEVFGAIKSFRYSLWMYDYTNFLLRKDPSIDIHLSQNDDDTIEVFANYGGRTALYNGDVSEYVCKGNLDKIIRPYLFTNDNYAEDNYEILGLDIRDWETYSFDNEWLSKQCPPEEYQECCEAISCFELEIRFDNDKAISAFGYCNSCCDEMIDVLFLSYEMMRLFSAWTVKLSEYSSLFLCVPNDEVEQRWQKAQNNPYELVSASHYSPVDEPEDDTVEIWVYANKVPCAEHPRDIESVTAYVTSMVSGIEHPININYCRCCNKYYINSNQYNAYANKYGIPLITLRFPTCAEQGNDYSTWREESVLHFLGYNVNATENLSADERRNILVGAIETGIMKKAQIVSFLESLVYRNKKRKKMEMAISKWNTDIEYIRTYQINQQRKIKGKFYIDPNRFSTFIDEITDVW